MTDWSWLDLLLFTGAVYGCAWVVTKSKLAKRPREALAGVPFVGELLQCIVCTGTWVAIGLVVLLPRVSLFSPGFRQRGVLDGLVLVAWAVTATWGLGRLLGDAD